MKTNLLKFILLGVLFQFVSTQNIQSQSKSEKINQLMTLYSDYDQFSGSVLVSENGEVIYKGGFGFANMEWDIPNESDTKHRLGSITKQFTSMLILQLVEQGVLDLHSTISNYLIDYPKETGEQITLHHLLTHSSGIPNYTSFPNFFNDKSRNPYTPDEFIDVFSNLPLEFKPGEKFAYSNSGYFLLGVIIEKVTKKTYEENLQSNIFDPLKMNNSGYDHHASILKNRATGYEKRGNVLINSRYLDMTIPYAAGSLYSTVEDLYLWDQALYTNKLVSSASKELLFKKHINSEKSNYGYGWSIQNQKIGKSKDSVLIIGHGGGINGFNTIISRVPSKKHLVVLLNNTGGANLNKIKNSIVAILYDKPFNDPKKSIAKELSTLIKNEGFTYALKKYDSLLKSKKYSLNENEMNVLGYELMSINKIDAAIAIFELNVKEFPKSFNTYDSLGEGFMEKGDNEKAITNYKKSVELNPNNTTGIEMLKRLGEDVSIYEKSFQVSEKVLKLYDGKYELMPNFIIEISHIDTHLFLQATGQNKSEIFASSEIKFYSKIVNAQVTFNKDESGKVTSLTLHQGGNHEAKKIE